MVTVGGQSLIIIILRAPLGGLCHRKMLASCCQKQFSSTLNNKRQYSNTAEWMAADVTKPQVSKKNQQQTNLRAFWTRGLTDTATPRSHKLKVLLTFIGNFCSFLARRQDFIVVEMPWTGYWSFWCIDGRGSGPSLWVVLNNKLQGKCICVRGAREKKEKEGGKWKGRLCFSLLEPL